jgi:hypothetical protein
VGLLLQWIEGDQLEAVAQGLFYITRFFSAIHQPRMKGRRQLAEAFAFARKPMLERRLVY